MHVSTKGEFKRLKPQVRVAFCLHKLEAEVNNGGFHQFFSNSTGGYVRETIDALTQIRAPKTRELLERAVAVCFPNGYPADTTDWESLVADIDDVSDSIEALDQEFSRYAEPLTNLVNEYFARGG